MLAARWPRVTTKVPLTSVGGSKKPPAYLEYVLIHELAHLLARSHDERFLGLMYRHLPTWRRRRIELNAPSLARRGGRGGRGVLMVGRTRTFPMDFRARADQGAAQVVVTRGRPPLCAIAHSFHVQRMRRGPS